MASQPLQPPVPPWHQRRRGGSESFSPCDGRVSANGCGCARAARALEVGGEGGEGEGLILRGTFLRSAARGCPLELSSLHNDLITTTTSPAWRSTSAVRVDGSPPASQFASA